jgi:hypothetical protein
MMDDITFGMIEEYVYGDYIKKIREHFKNREIGISLFSEYGYDQITVTAYVPENRITLNHTQKLYNFEMKSYKSMYIDMLINPKDAIVSIESEWNKILLNGEG